MAKKILRLHAVKDLTGLSRSTIYKKISEGTFPGQIRLGARAVGWLASDIEAWLTARVVMHIGRNGDRHGTR